jgi:hypothetical protein
VSLATPSTCTAAVTDTGAGTASTPTGTVGFASDGSGAFNPDTNQCTLTQTSPGVASCLVTYTPHTSATPSPTRTDTITATYGGDSTHADSSGTAAVAVRPTSRADCQHGGWRNLGFRNQGQCIQSLGHGPRSRGNST